MKTLAPPASDTDALGEVLRAGIALLRAAGVERAEREAGWLLEAALGASPLTVRLERVRRLSEDERARAARLFARRASREPLQYILGTQEFCGLDFLVGPEVLIPRPESELLVQALAGADAVRAHPLVADIGTGSGCLAVAAAHRLPELLVYAVDLSPPALRVARANAERHGVAGRIRFLEGDLCRPLEAEGLRGKLGAILSNPPYIADAEIDGLQPEVKRFEPRLALAGGPDGLALHRRLLAEAWPLLAPGGALLVEVAAGQAGAVRDLAEAQGGYRLVRVLTDGAGLDRVVCLEAV